ncbi:unnamed protein product [Linum tenue]|uniref:Uncharacterized protein n=1 Tax=Linum tenue TaxID=586396 RepID=A0AAV0KFU1_9ROSI|nr:unnamed protein product [Linum tenue]
MNTWELDAALDVLTMCSCHLTECDSVRNEVFAPLWSYSGNKLCRDTAIYLVLMIVIAIGNSYEMDDLAFLNEQEDAPGKPDKKGRGIDCGGAPERKTKMAAGFQSIVATQPAALSAPAQLNPPL